MGTAIAPAPSYYDGAGAMAGSVRGVSSRIVRVYPKAIYTHCASHVLNLCVVKSLDLRIVKNMMGPADSIARFFKNSPKRQVALEMVICDMSGGNGSKRQKLKEMCRTRWVECLDAFEVFVQLYASVAKCLEEISVTNLSVSDARSMYLGMTDFEFIVALVTAKNVMAYSKTLTTGLQGRGIDVVNAYEHVMVVTKCLTDVRTDVDQFTKIWFEEASKLAKEIDV